VSARRKKKATGACVYCAAPTVYVNATGESRCVSCADFVNKALRLRHRPAVIVAMLLAAQVPPLLLADAAQEACP